MTTLRRNLVLAFLVTAMPTSALAGEVVIGQDGTTTWQAGVDGVEIEWDGPSVKRIYSRYSTPVEFADRRGIAKAQIIAEEKAKAGILRFLQQSISSTRVVAEVQSDLNKATQERQSGTSANVKKVDQRTLIESLTEITTSFSSGTLSGVVVLEKGYDNKAEEAWVVVGLSQKTISASRSVKEMISNPRPPQPGANPDSLGTQPSEIRRSKQQDF